MDKSHQQAQETRRHNAEARVAEIREKTAALSAARHALSRVLEDPNATPEQVPGSSWSWGKAKYKAGPNSGPAFFTSSRQFVGI